MKRKQKMKEVRRVDKDRLKRTFDIKHLKVRNKEIGETQESEMPIIVEGYAAVFNSQTLIEDYYFEEILPGAFTNTLNDSFDVRCLFNHNWDKVLGRRSVGTLLLEEDSHGLRFEVELPRTSYANDLAVSMKRGDVGECSFLFDVVSQEENFDGEKPLIRIKECKLYEVSIVTLPAYDEAKASMRSKSLIARNNKRQKLIEKIGGYLHE